MSDRVDHGVPAIGIAGMGRMGTAMASRLASVGMLAGVHNRTWSTCRSVAEQLGVRAWATSAAMAADCDVIVTTVTDECALVDVYEGAAGVLTTIRPGSLCVEMSTIGVETLERLEAQLRARDCRLVEAPVSGSTALAASGELTILAGGDREDVERSQPLLDRLGARTFHLGALGAAGAMKLAVNNVIYGLNQALGESLVLAERAGIERLAAYEVFANSAVAAPFVHYRRALFERPDDEPTQMRLELAVKDMSLIQEMASRVGAELPQAEVNLRVLQDAAAGGYADDDVTAVAEHLRKLPAPGRRNG